MADHRDRFVVVSSEEAHARGWHGADCGTDLGFRITGYRDEGWELYDTSSNPPRLVGQDGGEPEDQLLVRNWAWVAEEMNRLAQEADRAVEAAVQQEREACANLVEDAQSYGFGTASKAAMNGRRVIDAFDTAAAIRARRSP